MNPLMAVSTAVAILASGVGLIVTLDQLTMQARSRRIEEWATRRLKSENNEHRREALERIQLRATARIVAAIFVPGIAFAEAVIWLVMGPGLMIMMGWTFQGWGSWLSVGALAFAASGMSLRRGIRIYFERQRLIGEFRDGAAPIKMPKIDILNQMEGGTRQELALAGLLSIGINAIGAGIGLMLFQKSHFLIGLGSIILGGIWSWGVLQGIYARAPKAQSPSN